jgi:hypothetical protein
MRHRIYTSKIRPTCRTVPPILLKTKAMPMPRAAYTTAIAKENYHVN